MLVLNKYGGSEGETKSHGTIRNCMTCVISMMLFVLMLKKDPVRHKSKSKFSRHGVPIRVYVQNLRK